MTRSTFRQNDLHKAIRAARAAGFDAEEVVITQGGDIRILAKRDRASSRDVSDEIDRWANGKT